MDTANVVVAAAAVDELWTRACVGVVTVYKPLKRRCTTVGIVSVLILFVGRNSLTDGRRRIVFPRVSVNCRSFQQVVNV